MDKTTGILSDYTVDGKVVLEKVRYRASGEHRTITTHRLHTTAICEIPMTTWNWWTVRLSHRMRMESTSV